MPNEHGWARIRDLLPNAIAYAVDSSGMQCAFDEPPIYHHTGKWIPTGVGTKVNLGLLDVDPAHFKARDSLSWAPDYEGDGKEHHESAQSEHDDRFPPEESPNPGVRSTDPNKKGPDADGRPEDVSTAEDLVQANLRAMGAGKQLSGDKAPDPLTPAEPAPAPEPAKDPGLKEHKCCGGRNNSSGLEEAVAAMGSALLEFANELPPASRKAMEPKIKELEAALTKLR